MGKKKVKSNLGKQLVKDRFGPRKPADSFLHTSELNDGFGWQKYNAQSVTEETSLEAFLNTAQLAGTEFTAERLNVSIVPPTENRGLLTAQEEQKVRAVQEQHKALLRIPRRPAWDETTSAEQLDRLEKDAFLEWRRKLSELQEKEHILMTPFERNIEFWRQLWRVIERSDIVVQIVDARNPLLFRSEDLETYVKEVSSDKMVMLLINKADYLSEEQRKYWANYFSSINLRVAFWSAVEEANRISQLENEDSDEGIEDDDDDSEETETASESEDEADSDGPSNVYSALQTDEATAAPDNEATDTNRSDGQNTDTDSVIQDTTRQLENIGLDSGRNDACDSHNESAGTRAQQSSNLENRAVPTASAENRDDKAVELPESVPDSEIDQEQCGDLDHDNGDSGTAGYRNSTHLLTGEELVELLKTLHTGPKVTEDITTVGLVGYPNVGKSSSINAILRCKKVPVSATPGRTKHFQTLYVGTELLLCDCPGLVMPSFVSTKAEMVLNGILPIDQMRDYVPPVAKLVQHISREVLEVTYGIMLPKPREDEDPERPPTAHELLGTYGLMRGFMSHKGIPDYHRSSRCILKDYVLGKLLFCNPPPGISSKEFSSCAAPQRSLKLKEAPTLQKLPKGAKAQRQFTSEVDREFFTQAQSRIGSKGVAGRVGYARQAGYGQHVAAGDASAGSSLQSSMTSLAGKPWKHHGNRGKKEKLRRKHAQLDVI